MLQSARQYKQQLKCYEWIKVDRSNPAWVGHKLLFKGVDSVHRADVELKRVPQLGSHKLKCAVLVCP